MNWMTSRFTGLPAGEAVDVLRSFSNVDRRTMADVRYRNVVPSDARRQSPLAGHLAS